jgi:hypothetical protein
LRKQNELHGKLLRLKILHDPAYLNFKFVAKWFPLVRSTIYFPHHGIFVTFKVFP